MSVLNQPYCTPSRVRGVYRYLLKVGQKGEERTTVEKTLSPDSLLKGGNREMIHHVITECCKMELLQEEGDIIRINPALPPVSRDPKTGDAMLPQTLANLILNPEKKENEDFCKVSAWYLAQNVYEAPGDWKSVEELLFQQVGAGKLGLNDIRYNQFEDWSCFVGLTWRHSLKGSKRLFPDPTQYLRYELGKIFQERGKGLTVSQTLTALAERCPVFEEGRVRKEVEAQIGEREKKHLSTVTSFTLSRLHDDKTLQLLQESDAEVYLFPGVKTVQRVSKIVWLGQP
ncbi:hypothetical protein JCM14036_12380 [Desulfotomaculum defluvii]